MRAPSPETRRPDGGAVTRRAALGWLAGGVLAAALATLAPLRVAAQDPDAGVDIPDAAAPAVDAAPDASPEGQDAPGEAEAPGAPGTSEEAGTPESAAGPEGPEGPGDSDGASPGDELPSDAEPPSALPPSGPPPEGTGEPITSARAVPNYDGLPESSTTSREVLLWIPRILTSPLYVVTEFVLRRPLGWLFLSLEQTDLLALADGIFLFGDNKIGIFPTAFFDFGFAPSFGIYFFWTDFLFEGNRISMNGGTFGPRWLNGVIKDQITFNENTHLTARLKGFRRPDQIFGDIGGDARLITSRYGTSRLDTSLIFDSHFWRRSRLEAEFGYRSQSFEDGRALGDPSISEEMISRGQALPDGFVTGYSAFRWGLDLRLDTREVTVRPNAGISLRLLGEAHVAAVGPEGLDGWLRWGAVLRGSTDILGDDRILSLAGALAFITPVGNATVPFTELIDIGALGSINGFLPGLVRGRSLAAMVASYEWPIWVFLNGRMHFAVGNVFDEHLEGFDAEDLRMSFGIGFEPTIDGESNFELAIAFGTDTFRNGPGVQSFRFVIGVNNDL